MTARSPPLLKKSWRRRRRRSNAAGTQADASVQRGSVGHRQQQQREVQVQVQEEKKKKKGEEEEEGAREVVDKAAVKQRGAVAQQHQQQQRWMCLVRLALLVLVIALVGMVLVRLFVSAPVNDTLDAAALHRLGVLEGEARVLASMGQGASAKQRLLEASRILHLHAPSGAGVGDEADKEPLLSVKGLSIATDLLKADNNLSRLKRYFQTVAVTDNGINDQG